MAQRWRWGSQITGKKMYCVLRQNYPFQGVLQKLNACILILVIICVACLFYYLMSGYKT